MILFYFFVSLFVSLKNSITNTEPSTKEEKTPIENEKAIGDEKIVSNKRKLNDIEELQNETESLEQNLDHDYVKVSNSIDEQKPKRSNIMPKHSTPKTNHQDFEQTQSNETQPKADPVDVARIVDLVKIDTNGEIKCLVKYTNAQIAWVPLEVMKSDYPSKVIEYYETRINWALPPKNDKLK